YTMFLTDDAAVLTLPGRVDRSAAAASNQHGTKKDLAVVRMELVNAKSFPSVSGVDANSGKSNYFIGSDPGKWQTDVPNYSKVRYKDTYPGIDLVYYGKQQQLEYDFVVAPGADPRAIELDIQTDPPAIVHGKVDGLQHPALHLSANGHLV